MATIAARTLARRRISPLHLSGGGGHKPMGGGDRRWRVVLRTGLFFATLVALAANAAALAALAANAAALAALAANAAALAALATVATDHSLL